MGVKHQVRLLDQGRRNGYVGEKEDFGNIKQHSALKLRCIAPQVTPTPDLCDKADLDVTKLTTSKVGGAHKGHNAFQATDLRQPSPFHPAQHSQAAKRTSLHIPALTLQ